MKATFLDVYDKKEIKNIQNNLEEKAGYFNELCDDIVTKYAGDLDNLMKWVYTVII